MSGRRVWYWCFLAFGRVPQQRRPIPPTDIRHKMAQPMGAGFVGFSPGRSAALPLFALLLLALGALGVSWESLGTPLAAQDRVEH